MEHIIKIPASFENSHCNPQQFEENQKQALKDPETFWAKQAETIQWMAPFTRVSDCTFAAPVRIRWYENGKLNVSENCIDRHLVNKANQVAILWEADDPNAPSRKITYQELHDEVCRMANVLKSHGVKRGDFVSIYMPMIPEAAFAMLACTRIGAPHSVVFGGFSAEALADRMKDCLSSYLITSDFSVRAGKEIPLKENADKAAAHVPQLKKIFVVKHLQKTVAMKPERDVYLCEEMKNAPKVCVPEVMDAEDPLFILYTSGSTNKPKGVLHTTAGYLVYAAYTHKLVFDYRVGEIYWCTADVGWVTGHSYIVYGPLCNGATTLMFEGVPNYPSASRFWEIVDKHKVNIFYTAPTAIRSLMREGDSPVKKTSRKSLRLLGSVGEPINPEAWMWYHRVVGDSKCPIVDTWWQTETGGILISPLPGATELKPGSATKPLFGIHPQIVNDKGEELTGECSGNLCLTRSWPGQMRTVFRDHDRFVQTYFSTFPGKYFTGDGCRRDKDGYYWITGRVDDVLNVSGHRLGTAEIESALVSHPSVAEAAVVGFPHDIKGQAIYAFVTLKAHVNPSNEMVEELKKQVRAEIGAIAVPDVIQWAPGLPKTRSGKIMRRILRKIAENQFENLGDISTLADPTVVKQLIENRVGE